MSSVAKGAKRKKQKTSDEVLTARTTTTKSTTRHDEDTDAERLRKLAHEIAERGTELTSLMGTMQHAEADDAAEAGMLQIISFELKLFVCSSKCIVPRRSQSMFRTHSYTHWNFSKYVHFLVTGVTAPLDDKISLLRMMRRALSAAVDAVELAIRDTEGQQVRTHYRSSHRLTVL